MSVINQMLKDLDQRNPETNSLVGQSVTVAHTLSSTKVAAFTAVCVLIACFVCFYVWQLMAENKALKAKNSMHELSVAQNVLVNKTLVNKKSVSKVVELEKVVPKSVAQPSRVNSLANTAEKKTTDTAQAISSHRSITVNPIIRKKSIANKNSSKVTPAKKETELPKPNGHSHTTAVVESPPEAKAPVKKIKNTMSVSRRKLSAKELAQQKLAHAEKALAAKEVVKAEKLLEDVVLLTPDDSQTRKKLAALWFGRQAYQDALNLLSQGLALNGKDMSLRKMKARIHLKQGDAISALNTLRPLAKLQNEQYQVMLANTAQQAQRMNAAVDAYKVLIGMQPDIGRWYLGLAVLYDKNSQFGLASKAYKNALTKSDLSISSEDFIKKRIQVIGQ